MSKREGGRQERGKREGIQFSGGGETIGLFFRVAAFGFVKCYGNSSGILVIPLRWHTDVCHFTQHSESTCNLFCYI